MQMRILLSGIIIFIISILIHVLIWRIRFPRQRGLTLFFVFFLLPLIIWLLYLFFAFTGVLPPGYGPELIDGAAILLLHFSLSAAYIMTYPAVEALSPTLVIALFMGESSTATAYEELSRLFPEESILTPRIMDLVGAKLVRLNSETLSMTLRGRMLLQFFICFRAFIGLKPGKG